MIDELRKELIGDRRAELEGTDLLNLKPVEPKFRIEIILRADGTALYRYPNFAPSELKNDLAAPFPETWSLSNDRVLSILIPIAPMPEYELPDWSQYVVHYELFAVSPWSLCISNRRFDGEDVIVLRRIDTEEFDRRQVEAIKHRVTESIEMFRRAGVDLGGASSLKKPLDPER